MGAGIPQPPAPINKYAEERRERKRGGDSVGRGNFTLDGGVATLPSHNTFQTIARVPPIASFCSIR